MKLKLIISAIAIPVVALISLYSFNNNINADQENVDSVIIFYENHDATVASIEQMKSYIDNSPHRDWVVVFEGPEGEDDGINDGQMRLIQNDKNIQILFESSKRSADEWFESYIFGKQCQDDNEKVTMWLKDNMGHDTIVPLDVPFWVTFGKYKNKFLKDFEKDSVLYRLNRSERVMNTYENEVISTVLSLKRKKHVIINVGAGHKRISWILHSMGYKLNEFAVLPEGEQYCMGCIAKGLAVTYLTTPDSLYEKY